MKKGFKIFNMKIGILLGPVDFLLSNASTNFSFSSGTVGVRKNDAFISFIEIMPKIPRYNGYFSFNFRTLLLKNID